MQPRTYSPVCLWLLATTILAICLVAAPSARAAQDEPANEAIKSLLKERLALATTIFEQRRDAHKQGVTSFEQVARAQANLLAAKLDLCRDERGTSRCP